MSSESEMNMATRTIRVEPGNDGQSVEADFFGFMAAGDHTYAGRLTMTSRIWYVLAALLVITICCLAASQGRWSQ